MKTFIKIGALTYDAENYSVPIERTFRDAWLASTEEGVITVDMVKARDIWRDKIRLARESEFAKLDAEFMKALETGADTSAIVLKKKILRNAPADPAIELAETPEDLKKIKPAGLNIE